MSTVVPPTPLPPPTQLALPRLPILSLPPSLQSLSIGSRIDVTVSQLLPGNVLQLTSSAGDVRIGVPQNTAVKPGDALILQVVTVGAQPKGQLTLPNGTPPPGLASSSGTPQPLTQGPGSPQPAAGALQAVVVTPGATVTATFLQPPTAVGNLATGNPVSGAPLSTAPPGLAATTPSTQPTGSVTPTAPGISAPATLPASATAQQPGATPTALPVGSTIVLKITGFVPPTSDGAPLTSPPAPGSGISLAPGATLQGTVSGRQGVTNTVVQTQAGAVSLSTTEVLLPGTKLTFEVVQPPRPPLTPQTSSALLTNTHAAPLLDGDWPAFDEALTTLRDVAPGAHTHVMQNAMPRADAQLTANVLFFLSALRGGDLKSWIGDGPLRILERARPDLAGRIREDLGQMTRQLDDPITGEWRAMGIPFFNGEELDRIRLLIRDHDSDDDDTENKKKGGSRFVIDLDLSRLGHLQIDGLVGENGKRLDLVVRSEEPLASGVRQDIRLLYGNALEVTGIDGSVGFQAAPANFVEVARAPAPTTSSGGGVTV